MSLYHCITVKAPINIALIKYWGKADETQMLPFNDSVSMTIESPHLMTTTSIQVDPELKTGDDVFTLNGQVHTNERIKTTIAKVLLYTAWIVCQV
jgi:diphosphomevalonate decarboxylase